MAAGARMHPDDADSGGVRSLYDRSTKADTYRAMGVRELWLVDPTAKEIEVRSFEAGTTVVYRRADILHSTVLVTIAIPVAAVLP